MNFYKVRSATPPASLFELVSPLDTTFAIRFGVERVQEEELRETKNGESIIVRPAFDGYQWQETTTRELFTAEQIATEIRQTLKEEELQTMREGTDWTSPTTGETFRISLDKENQQNYQSQYVGNTNTGIPLELSPYYFGLHSERTYHFASIAELKAWFAHCLAFGAEVKTRYIAKRNEIKETDYERYTVR